jgi:hypothetical protein
MYAWTAYRPRCSSGCLEPRHTTGRLIALATTTAPNGSNCFATPRELCKKMTPETERSPRELAGTSLFHLPREKGRSFLAKRFPARTRAAGGAVSRRPRAAPARSLPQPAPCVRTSSLRALEHAQADSEVIGDLGCLSWRRARARIYPSSSGILKSRLTRSRRAHGSVDAAARRRRCNPYPLVDHLKNGITHHHLLLANAHRPRQLDRPAWSFL